MALISPPRPPSLREGGARAKRNERCGWVFQHELVRHTEHGDAAAQEEGVADSITSLASTVRVAVQLDGEPGRWAEEVREVGADGKLAPEAKAIELPPSEQGPELTLRQGRVLAMLASEHDATRKSSFHAMYVDASESRRSAEPASAAPSGTISTAISPPDPLTA